MPLSFESVWALCPLSLKLKTAWLVNGLDSAFAANGFSPNNLTSIVAVQRCAV